MKKVVQFMHVSLDGFVAGPNGEMDWITVNEEMFEFVHERIKLSNSALYGRKTWEMMEGYWPTAGQQPNASRHDIEHSEWYSKIDKYVLSNTLKSDPAKKLHVLGKDLTKEINDLKKTAGGEILIFGSPSATHSLARLGLVDACWLFVNPVLLGKGIPAFDGQKEITKLKLGETHTFQSGVMSVNYSK
jgi:dihydrofolate reductase